MEARRALGLATVLLLPLLAAPPGSGASNASVVRFGVIAEEPSEPDRMFTIYAPFILQLRERLAQDGVGVGELVIARDLDDLSQRLVRGEVDFVLESVFPMLTLRERSRNLEPSLLVVRRGEREYRSVFFTRQESPIRRLADLRGRTLVLQALRSTSAFALPRAELARAGIPLVAADEAGADRGSVRYVLALAEVNQAIWVLHGKGDAGAFNEGDWQALPEKVRVRLRVFARSRSIERGLISFRANLEPATRAKVEAVMLALDQDDTGRGALAHAAGVTRFERLTPARRQTVLGWASVLLPSRSR